MATVLVNKIVSQSDERHNGRMTKYRGVVQRIEHWVGPDRVRTTSGDIWWVEACPTSAADYRVVR